MKSGDHLIACGAADHGTAYRSPTPRTGGASLPALLALLVSSAALPLLLLLAYHFVREAQVERNTGNERVKTLAAITATDAAAALGEAERLGRSLADRPLVRSLDPARCDPLIAEQLKLNRHFANIATVDAHGNSMCSPLQGSDAPVVGIGQPDWLANIKTGNRFTIGSPQRGVHSGRWIAVAAYPIRDAQGAVAGAVEIVILLGAFRPVVSASLPPGGVAGIIDSGGMVIAGSEQAEQMIGRKIEDNPLCRMILEGRADLAVMRGVDGIERVWAARPIPNTSWFATVGIPAELASAGVWAMTWRNLFIGLFLEDGLRPVMGNRLQIVKVLHNLVNNGVETMHAAGVAAGEPVISVRAAASGDMAEVRVRDRGPGISETLASRLFEPFFTTKPGGLGLGLPISRAVVRAHGGELWREPPGEAPGSEFHFILPFAP